MVPVSIALVLGLLVLQSSPGPERGEPLVLGVSLLGRILGTEERARLEAGGSPIACRSARHDVVPLPSGDYELTAKCPGFRGWLAVEGGWNPPPVQAVGPDGSARLALQVGPAQAGTPFSVRVLAPDGEVGPYVLKLARASRKEAPAVHASAHDAAAAPIQIEWYIDAESVAEPVLAEAMDTLDLMLSTVDDVPTRVRLLLKKATVLVTSGRVSAAQEILDECARLLDTQTEGLEVERATLLYTRISVYSRTVDTLGLRRCVDEMLVRMEEAHFDETTLALLLLGIGDVFAHFGDEEQRFEWTERARSVIDAAPHVNPYLRALFKQDWAQALAARGEHEQALAEMLAGQALLEQEYGRDSRPYLAGLLEVGYLLRLNGRLSEARAVLEQGIDGTVSALGEDHVMAASGLLELACVDRDLGDLEVALDSAQRAAAIYSSWCGPEHPNTTDARLLCARLALGLGRARAAWDHAWPAVAASAQQLESGLRALSDAERLRFQADYHDAIDVLLSLPQLDDEPDLDERVYAQILRWKGCASRDLALRRALSAASSDPGVRAAREELVAAQSRLSSLLHSEELAELGAVARLRDRRDALERDLVQRAGILPAKTPAPVRIRESLPAQHALVDFVEYVRDDAGDERHLAAWISTPDSERVVRVELGRAAPIETLLDAHLASIAPLPERGVAPETPGPAAGAADPRALAQLVWEPLVPWVGDAEVVIVSPDGALGRLPFAILTDAGGRFLIEDRAFASTPDAGRLAREQRPAEATSSALLVGGLRYEREATSSALEEQEHSPIWPALPGTRREIEAIAALHPGEKSAVVRLTDGDGTEERLLEELPRHAVVHLATHGFSEGSASSGERGSGPDALASRLDLAKSRVGLVCSSPAAAEPATPERTTADGLLTAEEIGWLDLSHVRLVVLSACSSGLGATVGGEGTLGLCRELEHAGAAQVLSALWPVADEATAELMTRFYRGLWREGLSATAALRAAQLEMLDANRAAGLEDGAATWGAFVLDGGV